MGAPVSRRLTDVHGRTPLHVAASTLNADAVVVMAKPWFDLDVADHRGDTALNIARRAGLAKAVSALLEAGARDSDYTSSIPSKTP